MMETQVASAGEEDRYRSTLDNMLEGCQIISSDWRYLYVNDAAAMHGRRAKEDLLGRTMMEAYPGIENSNTFALLKHCMEKRIASHMENEFAYPDGSVAWFELSIQPVPEGLFILSIDITERKLMEKAIRTSEERFRLLVEGATDYAIFMLDPAGNVISWNQGAERIKGYREEEIIGRHFSCFYPKEDSEQGKPMLELQKASAIGRAEDEGWRIRKDGSLFWANVVIIALRDETGNLHGFSKITRDITERKRAEEALRKSNESLAEAQQIAHLGSWELDIAKNELKWSDEIYRIFGLQPQEFAATYEAFLNAVHPEDREFVNTSYSSSLRDRSPYDIEHRILLKDGTIRHVHEICRTAYDKYGNPVRSVGIVQDITERKRMEEAMTNQLRRMAALRAIDLAILSSFDLRITMGLVADHAVKSLSADAGSIMLLNTHSHTLEHISCIGMRTEAYKSCMHHLGESASGRAALERKSVLIPDLSEAHEDLKCPMFAEEGFRSAFFLPLIPKGQVKGVMAVFFRRVFEPGTEWLDFFETIAGQGAIAIDNATLFDDIQRSRDELVMAYDATIEGWAKALDFRDKETEGHSRRVTELTVSIASAMGMSKEEMVHVRRGALLHDIGKLGIPDSVLLKPGKLTDEEWKIMKTHPVIAHKILYPIAFLRPAIEIPYSHHEKWDGTGYPLGRKEEEIPLAARIFSVVDVWDALRSDRPYRPAWTEEKAMDYIQSLAGKEFDLTVVEAFFRTLNAEQ